MRNSLPCIHSSRAGVAAAIDDRLVDLPALLALGDAGLHELAVDVHGEAGDRGVGGEREAVDALELEVGVVEEGLVDGGAGDAVLDVDVDVHAAQRQRPLAGPGRVAGDEVAAAHGLVLVAGVLQCVAGPGDLVAEALALPLDRCGAGGHGGGLTGLKDLLAGADELELAAQDAGHELAGGLAQEELGAEHGDLAGGAGDGEGALAGGDLDQGLALQEVERARGRPGAGRRPGAAARCCRRRG
jgi:hypothetical protein